MADEQGDARLVPAVNGHVDGILPWSLKLELLDVDDKIAHQEVQFAGNNHVDGHVNVGHDQPPILIHKVHFDLVGTFLDLAEGQQQGNGALRVHGRQLTGDDGVECAKDVQLPSIIRG